MPNHSLYAIYHRSLRCVYIGSAYFLRARLGRHAWDLENGVHHAPGLQTAHMAAKSTNEKLRVLGLDWCGDRDKIHLMEKILLCVGARILPGWNLVNEVVPSDAEVEQMDKNGVTTAIAKLAEKAIPSLVQMAPVSPEQFHSDLESYLEFTSRMRDAKRV